MSVPIVIGLERNRSPPPRQERADRPAGGRVNRDRQRGAEAVMVEQGVGSAQARARLHDLVGVDGPPDDAVVRAGLEREAEALLSEDGQRCSRPTAGGSRRNRRGRA